MEAIIMKMSPKNSTVIVEMERDGEGFYIIQSDLEKQRENSSLSVTWIALNLLLKKKIGTVKYSGFNESHFSSS